MKKSVRINWLLSTNANNKKLTLAAWANAIESGTVTDLVAEFISLESQVV